MKVGRGTCESSVDVEEGGMCLGRVLGISSEIRVLVGKYLYYFFKMKEERDNCKV